MTSTTLKKNITTIIKNINDKSFLEAVFTIINTKIYESNYTLTAEQKKELDKRKDKHIKGENKMYTWNEVKKAALKR